MNDLPVWRRLFAWVALLLLLITIAVYYVPHKPFTQDIFFTCMKAIKDIILAFGVIVLAGGIGRRSLGEVHSSPLSNLVIQAAFGLGMCTLILFGTGLVFLGFSPYSMVFSMAFCY
jgi:hypothetical protein